MNSVTVPIESVQFSQKTDPSFNKVRVTAHQSWALVYWLLARISPGCTVEF